MEIIRGLNNLPADFSQCAVTLGNFDGIHLGHQALIERLKTVSRNKNLPTVMVLFEPQPLEFFSADNAPARLMSFQEKCHFIQGLGIDYIVAIPFTQRFANMSAQAFIEQGLIAKLRAQYIVIGDDFRFGAKRQGGSALLKQYAEQGHFGLESLPTYFIEDQRVSSTVIRQALFNDDFAFAKMLLGRPYTIEGRVIHGNQLARKLGFPTANIRLHRKQPALHGVYFVNVKNSCSNQQYQGVANIGLRPTINGKTAVLEVHLFDFEENIYGQYLTIEFIKKIRNEVKFDSIAALQQQIAQDVCIAQEIRAKLPTNL